MVKCSETVEQTDQNKNVKTYVNEDINSGNCVN
jgi:hypothetical protein